MIDQLRDAAFPRQPPVPECWRVIGVTGDRSCPELERFIHCRNCPVLAEAARAELVIHEYAPARIKRCVTGRGDAPKDVVADMVARQLGAAGLQALAGMPRDASDALAAALTRVEERRSPLQQAAGNPLFAGGLGESTARRRS